MNWDAFTPLSAAIGGALIGLATALTLFLNGKIAGISGVVARSIRPVPGDRAWRLWFLLGIAVGGALTFRAYPPMGALDFSGAGVAAMAVAGLLVGVGTRVGGGCTSGHGVCGISRGSTRSIAATVTFMIVAALVVLVRRLVVSA